MEKMASVILAAGLGTRMKSTQPKVLHRVSGRPLVSFPVELSSQLGCDPTVVVVGHGSEHVEAAARALPCGPSLSFAVQEHQLGTGHAVMAALPKLRGHKGPVLILSGDVPLLDKASVNKLRKAYDKSGGTLAFCTFFPEDTTGYGRVIRDRGAVVAIREHRDCSPEEKKIAEVNAGIYMVDISFLRRAIKGLKDDNSQGEFYLTDLVEATARTGVAAGVTVPAEAVRGINDRVALAEIEELLDERTNLALMRAGVTIRKWKTVHVDLSVKVGRDTELGAGVQLLGKTVIGKGCTVEAGAIIKDSTIENDVVIKAYSVIEEATVKSGAQIGPMGRLRPGAVICKDAKVGNFVEIKNTVLGPGSKANHLAYLGDGIIGERVNVGAGTIFCNYDGFQKHVTVLEDDVFIGSDSQLVAPVTVGKRAYVASGSTVTKDVPEDALAIARAKQENKMGVAAALRRALAAAKRRAMEKKEE